MRTKALTPLLLFLLTCSAWAEENCEQPFRFVRAVQKGNLFESLENCQKRLRGVWFAYAGPQQEKGRSECVIPKDGFVRIPGWASEITRNKESGIASKVGVFNYSRHEVQLLSDSEESLRKIISELSLDQRRSVPMLRRALAGKCRNRADLHLTDASCRMIDFSGALMKPPASGLSGAAAQACREETLGAALSPTAKDDKVPAAARSPQLEKPPISMAEQGSAGGHEIIISKPRSGTPLQPNR